MTFIRYVLALPLLVAAVLPLVAAAICKQVGMSIADDG